MIIAAANSKGGVGKTTLAVHLADWLRIHGWTTVLVDCDAQRLSSTWLRSAAPDLNTVVLEAAEDIATELPKLGRQYEAIIVDAPGGLGETTGAILSHADAVFIPTGPSNLEIMALEFTTRTVHEVQRIRNGPPQTVVVPIRATKGRVTTQHLLNKAQGYGFGVTQSTLPYREIYLQVSGTEGRPPRLLWQLGRSKAVRQAALEMDQLFREVFPEACETNPDLVEQIVSPRLLTKPKRNSKGEANASNVKT